MPQDVPMIRCMNRLLNRRDAIGAMLAASGVMLAPHVVRAQGAFPNRAIRIVVPVAPGDLAAVAFNQMTGIDVPIIVYRGTAPAVNDVAGGHVPMMIEAILALLPMVRAGSVRAIAVTSARRSALAPEIPTMAEVGLP